jgi:hypothetical protein
MALNIPLPSPKVMVPKHSFETRSPVLPRVAYFMASSPFCEAEVERRERIEYFVVNVSLAAYSSR